MGSKNSRKPPPGSVQILVTLVPGSEELRAYNRIVRKYQDEIHKRQKGVSDDAPCAKPPSNCALIRGSLFALDNVDQKELPDYFDAAWKPKGRKATNEAINGIDPETRLDERDALLH